MGRKIALLFVALAIAISALFFIFPYLQILIQPAENQAPLPSFTVYFLNVGQGDSIFLTNGNESMLMDCGPEEQGKKVSAYLTRLGVYEIDYLAITHTDSDHMGGCAEILNDFYVRTILVDGQIRDTSAYTKTVSAFGDSAVIVPRVGDSFDFPSSVSKISILHANSGSSEPNQNSLVLFLKYGKIKFLFDSDCDSGCETALELQNIDADILKVAHHGSRYATSSEFLSKVTPKLAIISVGENSYGHPSNETLARILSSGSEILRTDQNNSIAVRTDGVSFSIIPPVQN